MSYTQTFVIKLFPADTGLSAGMYAKIYNNATPRVLQTTTATGSTGGFAEIANGEYSWSYSFVDDFEGSADIYTVGDVYQTSTALVPVALTSDVSADFSSAITSINDHTDSAVSAAVTAIENHGDANWDTATGFATPTNVTDAVTAINSHTDINLDAKVSTRMATFTYTAPDNATIALINNKTTNLPAVPASQGDVTGAVTSINNHTDINLDAKISTRATPLDVTTATGAVQTHGDSNWVTATGFATPTNVTDAVTAIETYGGAAPWTTATGFSTPTDITNAVTNINSHTDAKATDIINNIVSYDIDSTGGETVPLSKAIEVILGIVGGKCEFNSTNLTWTVYGRDGTTVIFQGITHGQGHRTSSIIP